MNEPKVSVIMPIYNAELYLKECLDSIINNTYKNLEIICLNDGSTDHSLNILNHYKATDDRIVLKTHTNIGCPKTRNVGLQIATGEYIAFIDADDIIHPKYFELLTKCAVSHNADMVFCNYKQFENKTPNLKDVKNTNEKHIKNIYENKLMRKWVWGRIFKKSIINNTKFNQNVGSYDDSFFSMEVIGLAENPIVYYIDEKLYAYRLIKNSLSHDKKNNNSMHKPVLNEVYKNIDKYKYNSLLVFQMYKFALFYRWFVTLKKDKEEIKTANNMLMIFYKVLITTSPINKTELNVYYLFYKHPKFYRIIRVMHDRTLLKWEADIKNGI